MVDDSLPPALSRLLVLVLLAVLACGGVLGYAYSRALQRKESTKRAQGFLEQLVLANRHIEVTRLRTAAGIIEGRHAPSGRDYLFSFRDLLGGRTAIGLEDYPVESEPGWRTAAWVPVYASAQVVAFRHKQMDGVETGQIRLLSATPISGVVAYYTDALRREGLAVSVRSEPAGVWTAEAFSRDRAAQVAVRLEPKERGTQILVDYSGR